MDFSAFCFPSDPKQITHMASELGLLNAGLGAWRKRPDGVEEFISSSRLADTDACWACGFMQVGQYPKIYRGYDDPEDRSHDTPFTWWLSKCGKKAAYLVNAHEEYFKFTKLFFAVLLEADWARIAFESSLRVDERLSYSLSDTQARALSIVEDWQYRSY